MLRAVKAESARSSRPSSMGPPTAAPPAAYPAPRRNPMNRNRFAVLGAALLASCASIGLGSRGEHVYIVEASGGA